MAMLDDLLLKKIRLIDYEKITDEKGNRLIAFGLFAGMAGTIDFLAGFGHYLLLAGYSTPLLNINYSYKYFDLEDAYSNIKKVSEKLAQKEIDKSLRPLIFAVTGRGRTAQGVMKIHTPRRNGEASGESRRSATCYYYIRHYHKR
jgi:alpha-aminoadipic semialdehyde synthase